MRKITIGSNVSQRWLGQQLLNFQDYDSDDKHQREFVGKNGVLPRFWSDWGSLARLTVPGNCKLSLMNFAKLARYKMPLVWKQLRLVEDAF
ncbi:hypothetical protein N7G274_001082 [Stereocaulon virgatum]|uniref:Uncharacterized protein n=1 Tax=Stereocaulon virgatum TaxID=373712 RepID=A0ABR4AUB8_9LECA